MQPRTVALLEDIRTSIAYIGEDTAGMTFEAFVANRRARQLVAHDFEIIGEAVSRMRRDDPATVGQLSGYPQIVGLCNALIHGYDVIDYPTVWATIHESLPVLEREVITLLAMDSQ